MSISKTFLLNVTLRVPSLEKLPYIFNAKFCMLIDLIFLFFKTTWRTQAVEIPIFARIYVCLSIFCSSSTPWPNKNNQRPKILCTLSLWVYLKRFSFVFFEKVILRTAILVKLSPLEYLSVCKFLGATADKGNCFEKNKTVFKYGIRECMRYL